jgi:hypothetical protein
MRRRIALLLVTAILCTGCTTFDVGRYGVSVKKLRGQKITVGVFTASEPGKSEIACRAVGPIRTPDRRSFEDYIRQALIDELTVAELIAESVPVTLTGNKIDFDSMAGEWLIDLTLTSSNGRTLNASDKYSYEFTYFGETACARTAKYFVPAVQVLFGKLVHDPKFAELLQ